MALLRDGAPVRTTCVNPLTALTGQVSTFEGLVQEAILQNAGVARLDWVRAEGLANFPGLSGLVAGAKGDMEELEQIEVDRTADVPGLGLTFLQGLGQRQVGVAVVSDSRGTFDLELRAGDLQGLAGLAFNGAGATDSARGGAGAASAIGATASEDMVTRAAMEPESRVFFTAKSFQDVTSNS